jgi:hypothetical protein
LRSLVATGIALIAQTVAAQTFLTADGTTDSYGLISSVLGAGPETPDCSHPDFGPHITQAFDATLGKSVFVFHIHVTPDNDRCVNFDRQRLEIKTEGGSPDAVVAFLDDTVAYRWKFKLDAGFQPSSSFTHIHQIKAFDGDNGAPIITLTPRAGSPDKLQVIHIDSVGTSTTVATTDLAPFKGTWVEAYEKLTYSHNGSYSLVLRRLSDGATLFTFSDGDIDLWRNGTTVERPKWGIYRSLNNQAQLRDEDVLYDRFCIAKAPADCPSDAPVADFSVSASPASQSVMAGHTATYSMGVGASFGFSGSVSLSVSGLPSGATASFSPSSVSGSGSSTLTVKTSGSTPPGSATLTIRGTSGSLSHTTTVSLGVVAAGASYEAEASGNTLSGTAASASCSACSGGAKVRFLGNGAANFVTVNGVAAPAAGSYTLTIAYTVSGTRSFSVSVNGGTATTLTTTGTSWSTPATTTLTVTLKAGANSIKFFNNSAFAADLDAISVR